MLQVRPRAEPGIRWRLGLGNVSFWDDTWFWDALLSTQREVRGDRDVCVSSFLFEGVWNFDLLCSVVFPSVAEQIVMIPISLGEPDLPHWIHSDGVFSLKSAWELIRMRDSIFDIFTPCWVRWLRPTM